MIARAARRFTTAGPFESRAFAESVAAEQKCRVEMREDRKALTKRRPLRMQGYFCAKYMRKIRWEKP